jgi:hypothetical protein
MNDFKAAIDLVRSIFDEDLSDPEVYDLEVVNVLKKHLTGNPLHSRAGVRLAQELIKLADNRAEVAADGVENSSS